MPVVPVGRCVNRLGRITIEEDDVVYESSDCMGSDFASSSGDDVDSNGNPWTGSGMDVVTASDAGVNDGSGERWESGTGGGLP